MQWILFFIVVVFVLYLIVKGADSNIQNRTATKEGILKIDVKSIMFDDVPQGLDTVITCTENEIIINTNGYQKRISHKDIIGITVESANQILSNPQFSMGKAMAGMALLGSMGAVAGVSGKNNELMMVVLSYNDDTELKYMTFLQQHNKGMTVKAEAFLLDKVCKDILEIIKEK